VNDVDKEGFDPALEDEEPEAGTVLEGEGGEDEPDVLLDVPELRVDEISLEVEDLRARVALRADVLQLLKLHVGVEAELGRVQLTIKGVEAQALLKVRLDNVARIIDRVLTTIDNNPDMVERLIEQVGEATEEIGAGASQALGELGAGAGSTVEEVGTEAGSAVGEVSRGAGKTVEEAGRGAAQASTMLPGRPANGARRTARRDGNLRSERPRGVPAGKRPIPPGSALRRAHAPVVTVDPRRSDGRRWAQGGRGDRRKCFRRRAALRRSARGAGPLSRDRKARFASGDRAAERRLARPAREDVSQSVRSDAYHQSPARGRARLAPAGYVGERSFGAASP